MNIDEYIQEEVRLTQLKRFEDGMVKYVCAFPDYYIYGLPNIGMQVIYRECALHPGVAPDRYYLPDEDCEDKDITWERKFKIKECDFFSFTISYEGSYVNILKELELCNIPLRACDRNDDYPIIIAGGPIVMYNCKPLEKFFDVDEINKKFSYLKSRLSNNCSLVISNDVVDEKVERRAINEKDISIMFFASTFCKKLQVIFP